VKLVNVKSEWVVEGMFLGAVSANVPLTSEQMDAYYSGIRKGTVIYKRLRQPSRFTRTALLTANNRFLIVPMTPDIHVFPTEVS